ncbi:MAG: hypothetical protein ACP5OX_02875, partial [Minisyncoccia bacterium]
MKRVKFLLILGIVITLFITSTVSCKKATEEKPIFKLATVMPGSIQDADYNTIGYIATQEVGK